MQNFEVIHAELGEDGGGRAKAKSKCKKAKSKKSKGRKLDEIASDDSLNDFIDDTGVEGKSKPRKKSRR